MHGFSEHELLGAFLAIALVLFATRGMAELSQRLKQPEVLGELLGGFLIGPSVLGALIPKAYDTLLLNPQVSLALTLMSWIGAILLLMIAGMEADLAILRQKAVSGLLAAAGAIGASLAVGAWIGTRIFGRDQTSAFFLGLVLSVTAVSVVAKLLIEREALRRDYAQVMLAAGITGEILVWPLISILSSIQHKSNPWIAGSRAALLAAAFLVFMFTLGQRFTYWAMRRVADLTAIPNGELSLVIGLLCISAAATTLLGLHPLLGAFTFGVILGKAPRATTALKERIQALTIALFGPIFFGLAGMRVNLFNLHGTQSLKGIFILLFLAGLTKSALGFLGAFAGKLPFWEAAAVGIGLNLKGGTDVVVAIVGTELLLLSSDLYTAYAVVAILTVVITPPILNRLAAKTQPGEAELKRLNREEARKLAYLADRERVLLPLMADLFPLVSAQLLCAIAATKQLEKELFDVTEVSIRKESSLTTSESAHGLIQAAGLLAHASDQKQLRLARVSVLEGTFSEGLRSTSEGQHILAMGASRVSGDVALSFGAVQDSILREAATDILVTVSASSELPPIKRILVPINGLAHSLAAADVAAYIAKGCDAEIVLLAVVAPRLGSLFWRERKHRDLLQAGYTTTREAAVRIARLEVRQSEQVILSTSPVEAVLEELKKQTYDLLVLGSVMRLSDQGISLGRTVENILQAVTLPRALLISRDAETANA